MLNLIALKNHTDNYLFKKIEKKTIKNIHFKLLL